MSAAKAPPRRHGLLLIDKPGGWTSHDVVARVRRLAGQKRVGHTGTLDPMATGLMAVLLGAATRLEPYLTKMDKSYSGRVHLGLSTDSDDITGNETARSEGPWPEAGLAERALKKLEGEHDQIPPAYSAISVGGQRAYKAARAGRPVELAARRVTAYRLEMLSYTPPFLDFRAEVSSGYYIRSLARDLGADLGLGGTLASLRRESVGAWQVAQAVTLEAMAEWSDEDWHANLLPPAMALPHLPGLILTHPQTKAFCQGQPIDYDHLNPLISPTLQATGSKNSSKACAVWAAMSERSEFKAHTAHALEEFLLPVAAARRNNLENVLDNVPIKVLNAEGLLLGLANIVPAPIGGPESPRRPFLRPLRVLLGLEEPQPHGRS